jgi:hypothetical protein
VADVEMAEAEPAPEENAAETADVDESGERTSEEG